MNTHALAETTLALTALAQPNGNPAPENKPAANKSADQLNEELAALLAEGAFKHHAREFLPADVAHQFLVFAATDVRAVNKSVLDACQKAKVLVCAVDECWPSGDFLTPATLRKDELTVSISSSGQSCRRSRLIKENLGRHLEMVETAELLVMGTSHDYLTVEQREPFHLVGNRLEQTGRMLLHVWGVHEFMLLNTCNRVELVAAVARDENLEILLKRILGFDHLRADGFYVKRSLDAFEQIGRASCRERV